MSQSPINIVTDDAQTDVDLTDFTFTNYDDTSVAMTLTNGGHGGECRLVVMLQCAAVACGSC